MRSVLLNILPFASLISAWMPGVDKQILAQDGTDLFNGTSPSGLDTRTLPSGKIRGVDLGSLFVFEPWIAESEWSTTGCAGQQSEFDCVSAVGQEAANSNFQAHWARWITQDDINLMKSYSLNTIRIPVGYWMKEDLVYADSEHFPQGGFNALQTVCGMASDAGMYIIIDMHGAPGAQVAQNSDTGQYASTPGFYIDYQYNRATEFLGWLTTQIHSNNEFRNVGMLEIVNEPERSSDSAPGLVSTFYPNAFAAIRQAESVASVPASSALHIQVMNSAWGPGDPTTSLTADDQSVAAFDNHRYVKWDTSVAVDKDSYLSNACAYNAISSNENPTVVGEFSISPPDNVQSTDDWATTDANLEFYQKWFAAQTVGYEKAAGWVFWTWKAQLGDYRWSYKDAVAAKAIPADLDSIYDVDVC